jgi:uncharacterized protein
MNVVITGGSGLVGKYLTEMLIKSGYNVAWLSRTRGDKNKIKTFIWNVRQNQIDDEVFNFADVIIHLAGAGVADKRWTTEYKDEIYKSRIDSTALLVNHLNTKPHHVKAFLSASAIGFYGYNTPLNTTEAQPTGEGFLAKVCKDWEAQINSLRGIRTAIVRVGVVLAKEGGFIPEVSTPIKNFIGAPLASGKQYVSWIHITDLCRMFIHILGNEKLSGVFNGVAPNPVTNAELTQTLANALHKPLFLPPVPKFVLRILFGEMSEMLSANQHIIPANAVSGGFNFNYMQAEDAVNQIVSKK